jgi:hypothetical protein
MQFDIISIAVTPSWVGWGRRLQQCHDYGLALRRAKEEKKRFGNLARVFVRTKCLNPSDIDIGGIFRE